MKKPTAHLGLTDAEFKKFSDGCRTTWSVMAEETLLVNGVARMKRNDVIDLVLDGDNLREYGHFWDKSPRGYENWQKFYDNKIEPLLEKANAASFHRVMKEVFPLETYVD